MLWSDFSKCLKELKLNTSLVCIELSLLDLWLQALIETPQQIKYFYSTSKASIGAYISYVPIYVTSCPLYC